MKYLKKTLNLYQMIERDIKNNYNDNDKNFIYSQLSFILIIHLYSALENSLKEIAQEKLQCNNNVTNNFIKNQKIFRSLKLCDINKSLKNFLNSDTKICLIKNNKSALYSTFLKTRHEVAHGNTDVNHIEFHNINNLIEICDELLIKINEYLSSN